MSAYDALASLRSHLAAHRPAAVARLIEALDDLSPGDESAAFVFAACPATYTVEFLPTRTTILELGVIDDALENVDDLVDTHPLVEGELFAWLGAIWKQVGVPRQCRTAHAVWCENDDAGGRPRYDLMAKAWRLVAVAQASD